MLVSLGRGCSVASEAAPTISLSRGAAAGAYPVLFARAQTSECEHLMDPDDDPLSDSVITWGGPGGDQMDRRSLLCPLDLPSPREDAVPSTSSDEVSG